MDGWMDGWMDDWNNGWMDGWMDEPRLLLYTPSPDFVQYQTYGDWVLLP